MTKKIAFLFPGQGSQSVGMGKDLYDNYESAKNVFDTADKVLGKSITNICFEGPEEDLKQTVNTQPSIEQFNALENGVKIEDDFVTSPSKIDNKKKLDNGTYQFDITIHEGKNRQVRKMVDAVGLKVLYLKRIKIGMLPLGNLPIGKYRKLNKEEINLLLKREK